mmetsp:Transcript_22666/g.59099  ORF Transcript_22666/g.59099 Transcript_22666/m.59099 type:complete len:387 (-) Transcript_22666:167-1327(-)
MDNVNIVQMFVAVTGASEETAARYISNNRGDMDAAVTAYFQDLDEDAGTGPPAEAPSGGPPAPTGGGPASASSSSAVDDIMGSLKGSGSGDSGGEDAKGRGKGGDADGRRTVVIVFFADGFMVDEDPEKPEPAPAAEPDVAPAAPRRTGMMGLSDLKKETKSRRGPMPKLPELKPLRSYDTPENKKFIELVKAGRVPEELQKKDAEGKPIPLTFGIEDARPMSYEELDRRIKQMKKMEADDEQEAPGAGAPKAKAPTLFAGAGQTLSSGATPRAAGGASASGGPGADPALLQLIDAGPAPCADESKPSTAIQLRLSSGARAKVTLNLDHTVADVWRAVADLMGHAAFRAASNHALSAGFPPKQLTDPAATLQAADLKNASVTHRCQ